jgi:hypothetical protein
MAQHIEMIGRQFGRLVVIAAAAPAFKSNGRPRRRYVCRCQCGVEKVITGELLRSGNTQSCGCFRKEEMKRLHTKHGDTTCRGPQPPEYLCWSHIIQRCENQQAKDFKYYGGRGIKVCQRWRDSYAAFLEDMGRKPGPTYSIDRIDNDGDYEPGNCRWTTQSEQVRNRRYLGREKRELTYIASIKGSLRRAFLFGDHQSGRNNQPISFPAV